jgi:uncharacterized protein (UPF0332 family)
MSEQEMLLEKARENLKAARLLIQEGLANIAASRAYYAMFYIAEALLLGRDLVFSSHSAVIAAYGKEFARTKALDPKFHRYLITSQEIRQTGDYGVEDNVSTKDAAQVIAWAEEFVHAADNFLGKSTAS